MISYNFKPSICEKVLLDNGFKARGKYYTYRTNLFKNMITLNILIDRENMELTKFDVYDENNGEPYVPFYFRQYQANNKVLEVVQKNYKDAMDKFVEAGIFSRED